MEILIILFLQKIQKDRIEAVYALRPQVDLFLDAQTCGKGGK
jgi:hypothetical protein